MWISDVQVPHIKRQYRQFTDTNVQKSLGFKIAVGAQTKLSNIK